MAKHCPTKNASDHLSRTPRAHELFFASTVPVSLTSCTCTVPSARDPHLSSRRDFVDPNRPHTYTYPRHNRPSSSNRHDLPASFSLPYSHTLTPSKPSQPAQPSPPPPNPPPSPQALHHSSSPAPPPTSSSSPRPTAASTASPRPRPTTLPSSARRRGLGWGGGSAGRRRGRRFAGARWGRSRGSESGSGGWRLCGGLLSLLCVLLFGVVEVEVEIEVEEVVVACPPRVLRPAEAAAAAAGASGPPAPTATCSSYAWALEAGRAAEHGTTRARAQARSCTLAPARGPLRRRGCSSRTGGDGGGGGGGAASCAGSGW